MCREGKPVTRISIDSSKLPFAWREWPSAVRVLSGQPREYRHMCGPVSASAVGRSGTQQQLDPDQLR